MKFIKLMIVTLSSVSLLALGACSGSSEATKTSGTDSKPAETTTATQAESTQKTHKEGDGHSHKAGGEHTPASSDGHGMGGQIVEAEGYHLEFLTSKADDGVSLDFMIGKGETHAPVTDAKVTAQVQQPDGTQQALEMKYDAGGKVYKAILPKASAGEYTVAILSNVDGKKMNSRFSFKQ